MTEKQYVYRRVDNNELVYVDWATMIRQCPAGYIELPDGVQARRCLHLEGHQRRKASTETPLSPKIVSDSLGFPESCLGKFEADRLRNNFTDVEFKEDPQVPGFYQVHCDSQRAFARYHKHRGLVNRGRNGVVILSQKDLDDAAEMVSRTH